MDRHDDDLRRCDLSHLRLEEMAAERRAELKRCRHRFVRHFGRAGIELERQPRREAAQAQLLPGRSGLRRLRRRFRDFIRSAVMT